MNVWETKKPKTFKSFAKTATTKSICAILRAALDIARRDMNDSRPCSGLANGNRPFHVRLAGALGLRFQIVAAGPGDPC
jgi:hypothetical protein